MKTLIRFFFALFLVTFTTVSIAQTFGVKAGLNISDMLIKDDDSNYSDQLDMNTGFHIGLTSEFAKTDFFSFETGLILSTKGYKTSYTEAFGGEKMEFTGKLSLYYLDIPLTGKATLDVGDARIFGTFGPYVGIGLSGKAKSETTINGVTEKTTRDVDWGSNEEDDLKRMDFGLTVGAGIGFRAFEIGATYGYGLTNISTYTDNGYKANNRVFGISLGYIFGAE